MKNFDGAIMDRNEATLTVLVGTAFLVLGGVVGTLVALSEQSLAQVFIAALFAAFGGSIIAFLEKLNLRNRLNAVLALLTISFGALLGTYSGIYVNEHLILTPEERRKALLVTDERTSKYLRSDIIPKSAAINIQYRNGALTPAEAYEKLQRLLEEN